LTATGIDEFPYVIKLLRVDYGGNFFHLQQREIIQEKSVVETLELNSPPCALVQMELISVKLNDREPDVFALKMPRYLTVLSDYTKMWTDHLIREGLRLVEAVEYMHSRNVVHMDIKESNIFVKFEGTAQLLLGDFRSSKTVSESITTTNLEFYSRRVNQRSHSMIGICYY
jgi:serine/threonine protein kinase